MIRSTTSDAARVAVSVCAALVVSCVCTVADAQEPTEADRTAYRAARDAMKEARWDAACPIFRALLGRVPSAKVALGVAQCLEQEGRLASAVTALQRARQMNDAAVGGAHEPRIDEEVVSALARIEPRVPRLTILVGFTAEGLRVTVDGAAVPVGQALLLDPGVHEILAAAPGFDTEQRPVTLQPGQSATERVVLRVGALSPSGLSDGERRVRVPAAKDPNDPSNWTVGGAPLWALGVGAGGVLFTGFGVGFAIDAADAASEGDGAREGRGIGLAVGLGVVGLAALGVATYTILSADDPDAAAALRLRVVAQPDEVTVGAVTRF